MPRYAPALVLALCIALWPHSARATVPDPSPTPTATTTVTATATATPSPAPTTTVTATPEPDTVDSGLALQQNLTGPQLLAALFASVVVGLLGWVAVSTIRGS